MKTPDRTWKCGPDQQATVDGEELLKFYDKDGPRDDLGSPISAITGLIGEDLVLGLLQHYLRRSNKGLKIVTQCKESGRKGACLDAWVITETNCYATEVKNWCASAFGGREVDDESNLMEVSRYNLTRYLANQEKPRTIWKVLLEMVKHPHCGDLPIKPLLAFWSPVALPDAKVRSDLAPFFECPIEPYLKSIHAAGVTPPKEMSSVFIFSASLYLRTLKQKKIRLCMPRAIHRLKELEKLIQWSQGS